jgi:hypothetical protein
LDKHHYKTGIKVNRLVRKFAALTVTGFESSYTHTRHHDRMGVGDSYC